MFDTRSLGQQRGSGARLHPNPIRISFYICHDVFFFVFCPFCFQDNGILKNYRTMQNKEIKKLYEITYSYIIYDILYIYIYRLYYIYTCIWLHMFFFSQTTSSVLHFPSKVHPRPRQRFRSRSLPRQLSQRRRSRCRRCDSPRIEMRNSDISHVDIQWRKSRV